MLPSPTCASWVENMMRASQSTAGLHICNTACWNVMAAGKPTVRRCALVAASLQRDGKLAAKAQWHPKSESDAWLVAEQLMDSRPAGKHEVVGVRINGWAPRRRQRRRRQPPPTPVPGAGRAASQQQDMAVVGAPVAAATASSRNRAQPSSHGWPPAQRGQGGLRPPPGHDNSCSPMTQPSWQQHWRPSAASWQPWMQPAQSWAGRRHDSARRRAAPLPRAACGSCRTGQAPA